jgi:hypothetical protein
MAEFKRITLTTPWNSATNTLGELMQPSIIMSEQRKRVSDLDVLE